MPYYDFLTTITLSSTIPAPIYWLPEPDNLLSYVHQQFALESSCSDKKDHLQAEL
jgi:hypothetical protein